MKKIVQMDAVRNIDYVDVLQTNEHNNKLLLFTKILKQKDDLIQLLVKEKDILENEKKKVQAEFSAAIRDKENIVIRFATVEKNVLDLKETLESTEKQKKKIQKEYELLNEKFILAKDEKLRADAALNTKVQEHKNNIQYIERLRNEISSLETKYKWNTVKLRQEMNSKQVNQVTMENDSAVKNDRIIALEKNLEETTRAFKEVSLLLENNIKKVNDLHQENRYLQQNILELQEQLDAKMLNITELQVKNNEFETVKTQYTLEKRTNIENTQHFKELEGKILSQAAIIIKCSDKETKLLKLNAELSTLNAKFLNELSLHKSKTLALMLDNDSAKANQLEYECSIRKLKKDLELEQKHRYGERLLMAKHLAAKSKKIYILQNKLDQLHAEAVVHKKKNLLQVKDFQRQISMLQKVNVSPNSTSMNIVSYFSDIPRQSANDASTTKLIKQIIQLQYSNSRLAKKKIFLKIIRRPWLQSFETIQIISPVGLSK
ncbi:myosin-10 isoform X2 [Wyeomyia smithii]|uniref:myosin-10 isoform X2 n=1 Tax=Wyeomyia smithii TaxID=174621 RepID=UPI002467C4F6|nr:myosin-10 isoform X2 [Wyeomyia smithii]